MRFLKPSDVFEKPSSRAFCWTGLICFFAFTGCGHSATEKADSEPSDIPSSHGIAVRAEPAEIRNIKVTIEAWGNCTALPQYIATIMPAIEGQVEKILAKPGDKLSKGSALIQLDNRIARANLAEKIASRDGLQASLSLLKAPPRTEDLRAQESTVQQAKIASDKAQSTVDHLRPLLTKGEIPAVQLSDAEAAAKQAELQYEAVQAQLAAMKLGPRTEAVAEAEARVKTADALVDSAQAQLDLLTLRSPIDGVLESLSCQMGQTISVGTVLGNVVDARQLLVTVWLPAKVVERVAVGQTARIASKGVEQDLKSSAENAMLDEVGEVTFVGKVADAQTGNIPVQLTIDNAKGHFSVGQMVSAVITIDEKKDVLAVPTSAVFDVGDGSAVCVIRDGKSVRTRGQFGVHDGHWTELLTTEVQPVLTAGEGVIVEGGYNLPDGTDVHAETSEVANTEKHLRKSRDADFQSTTPASQESTR